MTGTSTLVPEILNEYGTMTRAALRDYLPAREPRRHLYDLVAEYPLRGGKMMRSSLCIATACAFGARPRDALEVAVSIELLHSALLIHDDIEDGSEQRRGRPTLHIEHGVPLALNAGDTLTLVSLRPLLENHGPARRRACDAHCAGDRANGAAECRGTGDGTRLAPGQPDRSG